MLYCLKKKWRRVSGDRAVAVCEARPWLSLLMLLAFSGCSSDQLPVAPVDGKVLYEGKPLEFGGVLFQPNAGPPSRGQIQPDGTFRLTTYCAGDGAVLGTHRVQIGCYESERPGAVSRGPDGGPGKLLIPNKYTRCDTSGITIEVKSHNEPLVFNLVGSAGP